MRYFLKIVRQSEVVGDHEGEDFESLEAAVRSAAQSLRDMAAEHLLQGTRMTMQAIDIYDGQGVRLASVEVVSALAECLPCALEPGPLA